MSKNITIQEGGIHQDLTVDALQPKNRMVEPRTGCD